MGKGNQAKAQAARAKNAEKNAKTGGSMLKSNAAALSLVCQICRAAFLCNSSISVLTDHVSNKHPNGTLAQCFPEKA